MKQSARSSPFMAMRRVVRCGGGAWHAPRRRVAAGARPRETPRSSDSVRPAHRHAGARFASISLTTGVDRDVQPILLIPDDLLRSVQRLLRLLADLGRHVADLLARLFAAGRSEKQGGDAARHYA